MLDFPATSKNTVRIMSFDFLTVFNNQHPAPIPVRQTDGCIGGQLWHNRAWITCPTDRFIYDFMFLRAGY